MAFTPQTFSVGAILTDTDLNTIDANIDEVRKSHASASAPGSLTDGIFWLDTGANILKLRSGSAWVDLFTISGGSAAPAGAGSGGAYGEQSQTNYAASGSEWTGPMFAHRNIVTNPQFDIWQRGTTITSPAADAVLADRWRWRKVGTGVVTANMEYDPPSSQIDVIKCMKIDVTTADAALAASDFYGVEHLVEGKDARRLKWGGAGARSATLSFWVKASSAGTYGVAFQNSARNRSYVATYAVAAPNTWERKTVTVPGDTTGTWLYFDEVGLRLTFCLGSGTDKQGSAGAWTASDIRTTNAQQNIIDNIAGDFRLTAVQLEVGPAATPYDQRPLQIEYLLCFRYFWKTFPHYTTPANNAGRAGAEVARGTPSTGRCAWNFRPPTEMRATPAVTIYNPGYTSSNQAYDINTGNSFNVSTYEIDARHWQIRTSNASGNPSEAAGVVHCTADAELT